MKQNPAIIALLIASAQAVKMGYSLNQLKLEEFMQSGVDIQMMSDPICSSAGCTQYKQPDGPEPPPMDYFVPNFGMDRDIIATEQNERVATALTGHAWSFKTPESWEKWRNRAKDVDYNFDPELDEDMRTSLNSAQIAEDQYGNPYKWDLLQMQSDPICSSSGCSQYKQPEGPPAHPMDYFVPNFGMDKDIIATEQNEKVASALVGHGWAFKTPESWEKWRNRAKDTDYNFDPALSDDMITAQNSAKIAENQYNRNIDLVQTQDDPCYSSLGECLQTLPPKGDAGYPMDYKVPNFGPDPDMVGTMENEKIASAMLNHGWEFNTKKSFEKWRNRALDVQSYNFDPELSHDVRETEKHYKAAESNLGAWDVEKTTANMGYDYYEYQADRNKQAALDARARQEAAAAQSAAAEEDAADAKAKGTAAPEDAKAAAAPEGAPAAAAEVAPAAAAKKAE